MNSIGKRNFVLCHSVCLGLGLAGILGSAKVMATPEFLVDGRVSFVVSHIRYALSDGAEASEACPEGMAKADRDRGNRGAVFIDRSDLQQRPDESESDFTSRTTEIALQPDVTNLCLNPELGSPDPDHRSVSGNGFLVHGLNLSNHVARADEPPAAGFCAYDSFRGLDGKEGVDNQFYRVVGCTRGFQPSGLANEFATEMLTGSWGVLISIQGVDDLENDEHVEVGIYANEDPIALSPTRDPLDYATYSAHPDARYHATTTGKIVDGVLTTEPVDIRFYKVVNALYIDQVLRDARLQVSIDADGVMSGYLGGYSPVEVAYDVNFGFRDARVGSLGSEKLGPFRTRANSAIGKSNHMGYTCPGIYHALYEHADGHRDPETGECTSISTQYWVEGLPAFVVGVD